MTKEKSGYNIKATGSFGNPATALSFACKSKKQPGIALSEKIDVTTDASTGAQEFEPGDLPEVTDGQVTVIHDPDFMEDVLGVLGQKGSLVFTSNTSGKKITYGNAWISSYEPGDVDNKGNPTATITFQSGGGASGVPVVAATA